MSSLVFTKDIRTPMSYLYSVGFAKLGSTALPHNFLKFITIGVCMDLHSTITNLLKSLATYFP